MRHSEHPRTWADIADTMDATETALFRAYVQAKGYPQPEQIEPYDLEVLLEQFRTSPPAGA